MMQPAFYTSALSALPGDQISLYISAGNSPCRLEIHRIGKANEQVLELNDLKTQEYSVPADASSSGCGWPKHSEFEVPQAWSSGYYELALHDSQGNVAHHFLVVKSKAKKKNVLVLATNTYHAYNYWGGYNSYANVGGLMKGEFDLEAAQQQAIGVLSLDRPFSENIVHAPEHLPRLVNLRKREFEEHPFAIDPALMTQTEFSPFDGSAGFINKWEHAFVVWAEQNNIELDYLIDSDLENQESLSGYTNLLVVGHSEYWSAEQRDSMDRFIDEGGNFCCFSGNTSYWKIRHQADNKMIAHKWNGEVADPLWNTVEAPREATHIWSHPKFDRPESTTIGLSFLYGGYHRLGNCVSRGQGGFSVIDENHWSLAGADLFYGDVFGDGLPLLGYESDGCPLQFNELGRLVAGAGKGIPENLEVIAYAPTVMGEAKSTVYTPLLPPEKLDVLADIRFATDGKDTVNNPEYADAVRYGHAVIATFKKGKGQVFNAATTEWVYGLSASDPYVSKITFNVFERFGVI